MIKLSQAVSSEDISIIHRLFQEYADALGFDLAFQDFDKEISRLPGEYAPPHGRLYIAKWNKAIAGCIALRPIEQDICEMKRMYVRTAFRGKGIGTALAEAVISEAKAIGYRRMRLDTVPTMKTARHIYEKLGFRKIAAYRFNPIPGAIYMELLIE